VTNWASGLLIINILNPANPTLAGGYNTIGQAMGVFESDGYSYVADGYSLMVLRFNPTDINDPVPGLPQQSSLSQNYPNPFNLTTTIEYDLPRAAFVTLDLFDLLGRKIETLVNSEQEAGHYTATWNGQDKPSGMYLYRLQAGDYTETMKMLLLK
jgi:hypothetical protein